MSAKPVRLQLSRRKGFSLQALSLATNGLPAVTVARPSKWGNPYPIINDNQDERESAVQRFRALFDKAPSLRRHGVLRIMKGNSGRGEGAVMRMCTSLPELSGKNLACWCRSDQICHADVLLELANADPTPPTGFGDRT